MPTLIVYDSLTGNVQRFVNKLGMKGIKITPDLIVDEPYVLITYTIGFGNVPESTESFLQRNHELMIGVCSSGNRIWGNNFAKSADTISQAYNVPILLKFEISGQQGDVDKLTERVHAVEVHRVKQSGED